MKSRPVLFAHEFSKPIAYVNLYPLVKSSKTKGDVPFLLWASVFSSVKWGGTISLNQVVTLIGICGHSRAIETLENIIVGDIIIQERQARRTQGSSLGRS